jgi:hypothetical protein
MTDKHWSIETALKQIRDCSFECEAGPLTNNVAWQWLEAAAKVGPEFWPGQGVWFEVSVLAAGKTLSQWVHFFIVGCRMTSDTERLLWEYDLSYDPPRPWHYGTTHFRGVPGDKLSLVDPQKATGSDIGRPVPDHASGPA